MTYQEKLKDSRYGQRLFRIQDKEGRGPWRPGFSHKWVIPRPVHDILLPPYIEHPNYLEVIQKHKNIGTGCRDLKQLKTWINRKEYKTLLKYGYRAGFFKDCKILLESSTQSIFLREIHLSEGFNHLRLY